MVLLPCFGINITGSSKTLENLNKNYAYVCRQIANIPDMISLLADTLYAERFIDWETQNAAKNSPGLSPYDKAMKILRPAIDNNTHRIDRLIETLTCKDFNIRLQPPQEVSFCMLLAVCVIVIVPFPFNIGTMNMLYLCVCNIVW